MSTTADRLRLYEHAKETWGEEPARTLMDLLPVDPNDLATKADVALLGAQLRAELHEAFAVQTRTLGMWMITMAITCTTFSVGSVLAAASLG